MRHPARFVLTCAASAALAAALPAQSPASPRAADASLVVSTAWLAEHLDDPRVVVLHVSHNDSYAAGHVPGARALSYMDVVTEVGGIGHELPDAEALRARFERLGVSDSTRVIVYAPEAPMATRVLFTLDYIGHRNYALLDGGLPRWRAEGRALSREVPAPAPGHMSVRAHPELVATASWIAERAGKPGLALIDTRTDGEYAGTGERHGMPSLGHIAGARQLQWEELFVSDTMPLLKDRATLVRLYGERVKDGDTVVTYCWVGYRASATWFVARYLGYPVRLYDGSYQDWSKRNLAVRAGTTP